MTDAGTMGSPAAIAAWRQSAESSAETGRIADAWRGCVDRWWQRARRCVPSCEVEFDALDAMAAWLSRAAAADEADTCPLAAGLANLVAEPARGGTGAVFGHLRGTGRGGAALGLVNAAAAGPATVLACGNAGGWPRWRPIAAVADDVAVVTICSPAAVSSEGGRVVDAA